MNGIIGHFRIGEDIAIALDAEQGDPASVTAMIAKLKPAKVNGNRIVLDHTATATDMEVAPQGAAGWLLKLSAANSTGMSAGLYGIDARLTLAGAVEMTEQTAFISLSQAAVA